MRDAMKIAREAGRLKDFGDFDLVSLRLEIIRGELIGGCPFTHLGGEPSSKKIDEIYERVYGK